VQAVVAHKREKLVGRPALGRVDRVEGRVPCSKHAVAGINREDRDPAGSQHVEHARRLRVGVLERPVQMRRRRHDGRLSYGSGRGPGQDRLRLDKVRHVEHLAGKPDCSLLPSLERPHHSLGVMNFLLRRPEPGVDDRHLVGMDRQLSREAGPTGRRARGFQPARVAEVEVPGPFSSDYAEPRASS